MYELTVRRGEGFWSDPLIETFPVTAEQAKNYVDNTFQVDTVTRFTEVDGDIAIAFINSHGEAQWAYFERR